MDNDTLPVSPLPPGEALDLTEYESGFVDGYLAARGIFDSAPKEMQRALAMLKRHRQGVNPAVAQTPHAFAAKKPEG